VVLLSLVTILHIPIGWGLLRHKNWARIAASILAALHGVSTLVSILSVGMALLAPLQLGYAGYALWVLNSPESEQIFK
jgi:hypothetical protein